MVISKKFVSTIMAIVLTIALCPTLALAAPDAESLAIGSAPTSPALQAQSATVTQQQAVQWAEDKADTRWYNKLRDPADTSGETQCVELIHAYYEFLGYGLVYGDAGDYLYDANGACLYSEGWSRPPTTDAKPGDIAIWAGSPGHIGIVLSVDGGSMVTAETNYDKYRNAITAPDGTYQIGVCTRVNRQISEPSGLIRPAWPSPENPMTVTASDKSLKASAVKSAAKKVSPFAVAGASGAVTFSDAGSSKYLTVAADGKVTVKKGTPAGTYTAKAIARAAGDGRYEEKTVPVQAKVQVVSPPASPNALTFKTSPLPAGFKASWSKAKRASGYEIAYASAKGSAKGWQTAAVGNVSSAKVTGLKQSALYTVKIRSVAKAVDGKKYYSGWGAVSNVKTKANTYKVAFMANGGKGTMKPQTITRNKSTALSANKFTRSGYKFAGWNTKKNGKGKSYKNKAKVKNLAAAGKTVKLYAQWKKSTSNTIKTKGFSFPVPAYWRGRIKFSTTKCDDTYNVGYMTLVSDKKSGTLLAIHWAPSSEFRKYTGWGNVYPIGTKRGKTYTVKVYRLDWPWMWRSSTTYPPMDFTKSDIAIGMLTGGKYKRIGSGSGYSASIELKSLKAANAFVKRQVFNKMRAN